MGFAPGVTGPRAIPQGRSRCAIRRFPSRRARWWRRRARGRPSRSTRRRRTGVRPRRPPCPPVRAAPPSPLPSRRARNRIGASRRPCRSRRSDGFRDAVKSPDASMVPAWGELTDQVTSVPHGLVAVNWTCPPSATRDAAGETWITPVGSGAPCWHADRTSRSARGRRRPTGRTGRGGGGRGPASNSRSHPVSWDLGPRTRQAPLRSVTSP